MSKVRKLTDEQLSRVLSQQAIGKLDHDLYSDDTGRCCIAGAALDIGGEVPYQCEGTRAREISLAVMGCYPSSPEALLKYLSERGLA